MGKVWISGFYRQALWKLASNIAFPRYCLLCLFCVITALNSHYITVVVLVKPHANLDWSFTRGYHTHTPVSVLLFCLMKEIRIQVYKKDKTFFRYAETMCHLSCILIYRWKNRRGNSLVNF